MTNAGKGDTPRPYNREKYERNYDRIFGIPCPRGCVKSVTIALLNHCCPLCRGTGRVYPEA
jgi:hypothetical protein